MIETLILEDEPLLQEQIVSYVRELPGFRVTGTCETVAATVHKIDTLKPRIIISDIQLPDGYAFEALEKAAHKCYKLIFLTSYDHFAIQALKTGAIDYLLKPVCRNELYTAMQKARERVLTDNDVSLLGSISGRQNALRLPLTIRSTQETHIIQQEDVVYCKADGSYTLIFTTDGKTIVASKNIREYEDQLSSQLFFRPHKSYLVNRSFVKSIQKGVFLQLAILKDSIPIASRKKSIVHHLLQNSIV